MLHPSPGCGYLVKRVRKDPRLVEDVTAIAADVEEFLFRGITTLDKCHPRSLSSSRRAASHEGTAAQA